MAKILTFIFLIIASNSFLAQCRFPKSQTYFALQINNDHITSIIIGNDTLSKLPGNAIGYPVYSRESDGCPWDDNKNRFLFKHHNQYCITDSNLRIVIDLSDSIIPSIMLDSLGTIDPYSHRLEKMGCLFQVIRGESTLLFSNEGRQLTEFPYLGRIMFENGNIYDNLEKTHYVTGKWQDASEWNFGLINSNGKLLIANEYCAINRPEYWVSSYLLFIQCDFNLSDEAIQYNVFSTISNSVIFKADKMKLEYDELEVFTFEQDGYFGIYHPALGVLSKAKFTKIYKKRTGRYSYSEDLTLVNKKGKEITWVIPEEVWNLYPTLED